MTPSFSLEEQIRTLEAIEEYFQKPTMNIEEALKKHSEAVRITKEIQEYLKHAESSIASVEVYEQEISGELGAL